MSEHLWTGPDGADPLGFLAAIGAFRLLSLSDSSLRLSWTQQGPRWRPCLHGALTRPQIITQLVNHMRGRAKAPELCGLGDEVRVEPEVFRAWVNSVIGDPQEEWAAALGAVVAEKTGDKTVATPFHMMGGPQKFLAELRRLAGAVEPIGDFSEALYGPWEYARDQSSYGWDPSQGVTYAYLARKPEVLPYRSVRGALWLLVEAIPLFPCFSGRRLQTNAFVREGAEVYLQWPIWSGALSLETIQSLLAARFAQEARAPDIQAVYRSQRVQDGYYARFRPSTRM